MPDHGSVFVIQGDCGPTRLAGKMPRFAAPGSQSVTAGNGEPV